MKANVDLTENRIFRTPTPPDEITKTLILFTYGKFPWNRAEQKEIKSDDDLGGTVEQFSPIPLGDGEARRLRKSIENALSVEMCDRCGNPVKSFPWELRECLCVRCSQALDAEYGAARIFRRYKEVVPDSDILDWF